MAGALDGIRVADFTRVFAGPICGMTLADLGADVVKIENPEGGDDTRASTPPDLHGLSPAFIAMNRNKRSIVLDLASDAGRATARAMCDAADVVLENFSGGVMAKYGLDYQSLLKNRPAGAPKLIYMAVSAYGRTGPFADRVGYDPVVQAESGFMSMTGHPGGEPVRTAVPMIDVTTGMTATQAVLAAIFHRMRKGEGQFVEVPLFDVGFAMTMHAGTGAAVAGDTPTRVGNGSVVAEPIGTFQARDGLVFLSIAGDRPWKKFANDVIGRPDLADHPDYATNENRFKNRVALRELIEAVFATADRNSWVDRLRAAGAPGGPIRTIPESYTSDETRSRGAIGTAPNPAYGEVPNVRSPLRLQATPVRTPFGAPLLGQHTAEVLKEWLGYDDSKIAALTRAEKAA